MNRYISIAIISPLLLLGLTLHSAFSQSTPHRTAYPVAWPSPMPSPSPGQPGPGAVLLYELQSKLGVTATTTDTGLLVDPLPGGITQTQVQQAINAWSPSDTIPPTPAESAKTQIQAMVTSAGGWSKLSAADKDKLQMLLVQERLNQVVNP